MALTFSETKYPLAYDTRTSKIIYFNEVNDGENTSDSESDSDSEDERIEQPTKYNGHLEPVPHTGEVSGDEVSIIYITGASGGGKSTVAVKIACNYHRMFPKNKIIMFTNSDESKAPLAKRVFLAKMPRTNTTYAQWLGLKRYYVGKELLKHKFTLESDYANSLVIFDDFMYFEEKDKKIVNELKDYVISEIKRILNLGRKLGISCMITSHLIYERENYELYRNIFSEAHQFIWCPRKIAERQLTYALSTHFGLDNHEIRLAKKFDYNSHYICFTKYPRCIQSENKIELLLK